MMEIRSYRRVFDLERRIYRVDRLRLNPGGIPVRGVVYFLAILAASIVSARLPVLAIVARAMPWYLRDLALPGLGAALLTIIRVEGRPFHLAARAIVRFRANPRSGSALRHRRSSGAGGSARSWRPERILMLPDGSDARMRRLRFTGPGALLVRAAHEREVSTGALARLGLRPHVTVRQKPGESDPPRGEVILLRRAVRLKVR
jgi:hypothetical protein